MSTSGMNLKVGSGSHPKGLKATRLEIAEVREYLSDRDMSEGRSSPWSSLVASRPSNRAVDVGSG